MSQYILLRNTPFSAAQDDALCSIIRDNGYEPILLRDADPGDDFPWDECVAVLGIFTKDYIPRLPKLRWLQMSWAGVDALRGAVYPNPETVLTNASGGYGPAIAEYLLGGAVMLLHNFHTYMRIQERKEWNRIGVTRTLYGSTVIMIGLGDIGGRFARYAKAMGARVLGVRRSAGEPPEGVDELVPYNQLLDVLPEADVVAMCLPATNETEGLFSARHVAAMKRDSVFVNAGRGSTVDEDALIKALQSHAIAGAALDVTQVEPLPKDSPLWSMDNVMLTPHCAGRMDDPTNAELIYHIFEDNLHRFFAGKPLNHVVDRTIGY